MVALLWSQLVLASHPACTLSSMVLDAGHAALKAPCHDAPAPADAPSDAPVCESHCSRGDLSPDVARVLAVPALGPIPAVPVMTVQRLPHARAERERAAPDVAWHRPTPHPASLLLI